MKKIVGCVLLMMLVAACASKQPVRVGGDRDAHGCIGSAGYVWNESLQQCVRPWEVKN